MIHDGGGDDDDVCMWTCLIAPHIPRFWRRYPWTHQPIPTSAPSFK